ncbi:MAG: hypothetical protein ACLSA6_07190 [Holdemania massiliensis]
MLTIPSLKETEAFQELNLPEDVDLFPAFADAAGTIRRGYDADNAGIQDAAENASTVASAQFVKMEYRAIGINTDSIQLNYIFSSGLRMLGLLVRHDLRDHRHLPGVADCRWRLPQPALSGFQQG